MREILFRGKRVDNGEWVYGSYINSVVKNGSFGYIAGNKVVEPEKILKNTLGQFTGLTDKNGTKIFEGDIVAYVRDEEVGQIAYHESEAMFVVEFDTWLIDFDHMYGKDLEVIGNIHDNPELLKE